MHSKKVAQNYNEFSLHVAGLREIILYEIVVCQRFRNFFWKETMSRKYHDCIRRRAIRKEVNEIYKAVREKHRFGGVPLFYICDEVKTKYESCKLNYNGNRELCYDEKTDFIYRNPCITLCIWASMTDVKLKNDNL